MAQEVKRAGTQALLTQSDEEDSPRRPVNRDTKAKQGAAWPGAHGEGEEASRGQEEQVPTPRGQVNQAACSRSRRQDQEALHASSSGLRRQAAMMGSSVFHVRIKEAVETQV